MFPVKNILCPTDFSEPSFEALKIACELARRFSARLLLMNVVTQVPILPGIFPYSVASLGIPKSVDIAMYRKELESSAKDALRDVINKRIAKKIKVMPIIKYGDAAEQILKIADKQKADLIVISTHGRTGWRHFIFGSVAEKVIRLSKHPVLTIRAPRA
jgi:nucleotide-binding universal stress UspA family protein